ncbi:MAG: Cna B-type domain-containing protein, partial [Bacteroidales bacterium]|nr:Cna B-type domain-containing protein [Bacteroidales bacterium]
MAHIDGGTSNPGYFTSNRAVTTDISGTIEWDDNNNQDGIRPQSVTVSLLDGNGQQVTDENENPVIDTAGPEGEWTFSFPSVSKYDSNGKPIEYTVNTNAVTGYNVTVDGSAKDGFTITCTHDPVTENIQVTKAWNDASNQDGVRPESITLNLIADGETDEPYATVTLSAQGEDVTVSDNGNEWTYIFKGVPVMKNGNPVVYTLTETLTEKDSENYSYELSTATKEINDNGVTYDGYSFTVTNTHEPAKIDITGEIVWDDANDQDGMRPDYVTVQVYGQDKNNPVRSFEVEDPGDSEQGDNDDDNTWTWSATGLDKYYGGGNEIQYTVQEVLSDGLENIYDIDIEGFTITNTHEPETIDIFGAVIWEDENNQDGLRPASVTVRLLSGENVIATTTVAAGGENNGDWTFSFTDIDKYADGGKEVEYSVEEILSLNLEEIYTIEITGDMDDGFVITNMHTPETIEISGTITWDDASNQDGKRPDKVGVQLFGQDSEGGTLKTREFTVESDGTDVWTWSMEVSRYRDGGVEVQYTVIYAGVDLNVYTQKNDGLDTTYSYTPETCTIFGSKTWVDDNNQDNTRPGSITIELHANGTVVDSKEVTDADGWAWSFEDVPVYSGGHKITYLITEDEVDDYDTVYTFDEDGSYNVTNTLDEGETSVTVIKDWEDAEDQDGKRPESVTVVLLRDGQIAKDHDGNDAVITLTEEGHWIGAFTKIDKYDEAGARIEYTLQEVDVNAEGYESAISGDMEHGYTVTNTYSPEQIDITGTKIWNDAEDQDGLRPDSVTIRLYADGSQVSETAVTAGDNDDWTFTFTGLDKYAAGSEISYTVSEEPVKDYESAEITGSAEDGFTVTNTHTPETIDISGIKVWDDDDDRDGLRPGSITVTLLADGNEFETTSLRVVEGFWGWFNSIIAFFSGQETVTPDDNGNWSFSFTDLPKYRDGGIEIEYTIVEDEVEGYDTSVSGNVAEGFTITNTHEIETVTVAGSKIWDDANDQDGKRPASVQINLLADKEAVLDEYGNAVTVTLNEDHKDEDGKWNFSFEDLPKYHDGGKEYTYSITEEQSEDLEEYTTSYDGYDVTNSYTPELLNGDGTFRVVLVWDDEADNDGIRPAEVNVTLTKDNTAVEGATLTLTADETDKDGNWTGTFENLPKCENGAEISYSVKEDYLSGYTYRIEVLEDDAGNTYVQLTNVHVSVKENIEVTKIWDDWNNQDGKRPSTISVRLLLNGSLYKTVTIGPEQEGTTVSKDGNQWSYTMKDIPVDKNGETVEYTVIEVDVDNYDDPYIETIRGDEVTDNGVTYQPYSFEVTNSHTPEQIEISGTKVWDDGNDQDGLRPHYVSLHLYADGVKVDDLDVTAADDLDGDGSWEWSFPAYDKYSGGRAIEYTVEEDPVEDYGTEITGSSA